MQIHRFHPDLTQVIILLVLSAGVIIGGPSGLMIEITCVFFLAYTLDHSWPLSIGYALMIIGILFRILHWSGAVIILVAGMTNIYAAVFYRYLYKKYAPDKLMIFISAIILGLTIFLTLKHYPYSSEAFIAGFSLLVISYSFRFFLKNKKTFEDFNKLALVICWSSASVFTINHWIGGETMVLIFAVLLWMWLIPKLFRQLKHKTTDVDG